MLKKDRIRRKKRIRGKISGTTETPRLTVFRSNKAVYAQIVDDTKGITVAEAHGKSPSEVGKNVAEKATKKKVSAVVFDRNGYVYHGRVQKVAEGAREGGLKF